MKRGELKKREREIGKKRWREADSSPLLHGPLHARSLASTLLRRSLGLDHPAVDSLTVLYATPLCLKETGPSPLLSPLLLSSWPLCAPRTTRTCLYSVLESAFFSQRHNGGIADIAIWRKDSIPPALSAGPKAPHEKEIWPWQAQMKKSIDRFVQSQPTWKRLFSTTLSLRTVDIQSVLRVDRGWPRFLFMNSQTNWFGFYSTKIWSFWIISDRYRKKSCRSFQRSSFEKILKSYFLNY